MKTTPLVFTATCDLCDNRHPYNSLISMKASTGNRYSVCRPCAVKQYIRSGMSKEEAEERIGLIPQPNEIETER